MNKSKESLGAEFAKAIDGSGFTKSELAREVGVSPQSVNNWLARGVPPRYAFQVARLLNATPSAISGVVEKESFISISPYNERLVVAPMYNESGEGVDDCVIDVTACIPGLTPDRDAFNNLSFVAVIAESSAMSPEINEGDITIVDTARPPRPGDVALARDPGGRYLIRRYSEVDTEGTYRLTPSSEDWPTITTNPEADNLDLVGTVIAVRKLCPAAHEYR